MKIESCANCEQTATVTRRNFPLNQMGIPVILENIEVIECSECGSAEPVIPNMDGLMISLATAVISKPSKLDGNEIRFLRKVVGKGAREFARFLHVDATHLSKVENNRLEVGDQLDKLVRLLAINMNPELNAKHKIFIDMMPNIEDLCIEDGPSLQIDPDTMRAHYALA